jgi:protein gp37
MSDKTGISWCDATFNPWWGCTKVSPACDHCYAERDAHRFAPTRVLWGVGSERRTFDDKHWQTPRKWAARGFAVCTRCAWRGEQRAAIVRDAPGETMPFCPECDGPVHKARRRVFCASMGDWLDLDAPLDQFVRLLDTIMRTPELDWLLLSKRIGNWRKRLEEASAAITDRVLFGWVRSWINGEPPANVVLMATIIDQGEYDRDIGKLLRIPARTHGLSIEPMLGPIDMRMGGASMPDYAAHNPLPLIGWVICGGESGQHARPAHPDWFRSLRDQCAAAAVPFHFKQWGEHTPGELAPHPTYSNERSAWRLDQRGERWHDPNEGDKPREQWAPVTYLRPGKAIAGRLLDGTEHNGFPA